MMNGFDVLFAVFIVGVGLAFAGLGYAMFCKGLLDGADAMYWLRTIKAVPALGYAGFGIWIIATVVCNYNDHLSAYTSNSPTRSEPAATDQSQAGAEATRKAADADANPPSRDAVESGRLPPGAVIPPKPRVPFSVTKPGGDVAASRPLWRPDTLPPVP